MDGNVLSILASLAGNGNVAAAGGMGQNVLQALTPPAPALASPMPQAVQAPPVAPPPQAPQPEGRVKKRNSVIDVIGRLADTFATVGGAQALYQPTLDAREDRVMKGEDRQRDIEMDGVTLATGKFALGGARNERLGQVARGLKAIGEAGGDINQAWPVLAQRMGVDPETVAAVGQDLATNPNALDGLIAATTDPKFDQAKYGGSVIYGKDKDGNLVAYQPGLGNEGGRNVLPEGVTPIDPLKFVDTGGTQTGVGSRSGRVSTVLRKTVKPDTVANNQTAITIAGMPARTAPGKGKAGEDNTVFAETARGTLGELRTIYGDLKKMGAMVSPGQGTGQNIGARLRASGAGQMLEGAVGTRAQTQRDRIASIRPGLMQSIAKATGMTGRQLDSNADVKLFMQTVTNPAASYEANIKAIEGLERFIANNSKKPAAAAPAAPARTPARPKAKDGWTVVKVK